MFKKFILYTFAASSISYLCLAMKVNYQVIPSPTQTDVPHVIQMIYAPENKKKIVRACVICGVVAACSCVCSAPIGLAGLAIPASNSVTSLLGVSIATASVLNACYTPVVVALTCCNWGCGYPYRDLYNDCRKSNN